MWYQKAIIHAWKQRRGSMKYEVQEADFFGGGFEVVDENGDVVSEVYTYAAEAQELCDELNKESK